MDSKRILILGAGRVSGPVIDYLSSRSNWQVVVLDQDEKRGEDPVFERPNVEFHVWSSDDLGALDGFLRHSDIMISLLPAWMHHVMAKRAIDAKVPVVTASYVSDEMRKLDALARDAGVIVLNEMGVDPGIDHMSALRVINQQRDKGRTLKGFWSYTGGLPAPWSNNNPWGYKLSWSPLSVVVAATNDATYKEKGRVKQVPSPEIFLDVHTLDFDEVGELEAYPNRNSLIYEDLYDIHGVETIYRGTLRYKGWCRLWYYLGKLGFLSKEQVDVSGLTRKGLINRLTGIEGNGDRAVCRYLGIDCDDPVIEKMRWIGMFEDTPIDATKTSMVEYLADLMGKKLNYEKGEQDMIVMRHVFEFDNGKRIESTMIHYGEKDGFTAMAKTVGLPVAIGADLILNQKINLKGVHIPNRPEIYLQVLELLEDAGIIFEEVEA